MPKIPPNPGPKKRAVPQPLRSPAATRLNGWQFHLSRQECQVLNQLSKHGTMEQVRNVVAPIVSRVLGLPVQTFVNGVPFCDWVERLRVDSPNLALSVYRLIDANDPLTQRLVEHIFVGMTSFFRHFSQNAAFHKALGDLFETRRSLDDASPVRIWVPGCSTGNEAYTIAILLKEKGYDQLGIPLEVLGTDIVSSNVEKARAGRYYYTDDRVDRQMETGTEGLLDDHREYFYDDASGRNTYVRDDIRAMARFEVDNLLYTQVKGEFDVISCHHVLEHFFREMRSQAAAFLVSRLRTGGFLVSNDSIFRQAGGLRQVFAENRYAAYVKTMAEQEET